jgi:membrane-associated protease RseP (regulator of RpoE activity)
MQGQQPYLDGSIRVGDETIPSWFILDVGAADTMTFTTPFIAAHQLLDRAGDKARNVLHVAAPDVEAYAPTNVRGLVDAITLGGITLPHVFVNFSVAKNGAYTSPAFDGNVGETLLSRFHDVILDYGRSEMTLEPGPDTTQPTHERTTFGLTIIASGDAYHTFNVTAVGKDSPAARAGFQKGDVITAVDDTPAAQLNLALLKGYFGTVGPQHTVTVHRGADDVKLAITVELVPLSGLK